VLKKSWELISNQNCAEQGGVRMFLKR
jgi:hypothetical protein